MKSAALHLLLIGLAVIALLPFAWLICTAFKTPQDLLSSILLPWGHLGRLTLDNFRTLADRPVMRWLVNSIFLSSVHTVLVVTLSSLGGFALAKYQFAGKTALMVIMLATMLMPSQVLLPGNYELMYRLHWLDSYLAIIIPGAVSVFGMLLFRQAMLGVPDRAASMCTLRWLRRAAIVVGYRPAGCPADDRRTIRSSVSSPPGTVFCGPRSSCKANQNTRFPSALTA